MISVPAGGVLTSISVFRDSPLNLRFHEKNDPTDVNKVGREEHKKVYLENDFTITLEFLSKPNFIFLLLGLRMSPRLLTEILAAQ